jgi:hypothetical protein
MMATTYDFPDDPREANQMRVVRPVTGEYVCAPGGSPFDSGFTTLGRIYWQPIPLALLARYQGLGLYLSVQGVGGTSPSVLLALYKDDGNGRAPVGDPIAGTAQSYSPTSAVGEKFTAWSSYVNLGPKVVWAASQIVSGSAFSTPPQFKAHTLQRNLPRQNLIVPAGGWYYDGSATATALPTVPGAFTGQTNSVPVLGVKAA